MPVVKIGRRKTRLDCYVCNKCTVCCVMLTFPKPHKCPFELPYTANWVKTTMKVEKKGD